MDEGPIIVTGCQRSGTTIAAHILGQEKKWVVWDESKWIPDVLGIYVLQEMIESGRTDLVIQSPTVLHDFVKVYHQLPQVHFVGMKRKTKHIIESMKRIKWYQDDVYHYLDFYHDHIRFMNNQWGLLKQMLPPETWTEVNYNELKDYSQFVPKDQRLNFTSKQWEINKPIGPQYWSTDPYWRKETPKISNQSSKLQIKKESSENFEKI